MVIGLVALVGAALPAACSDDEASVSGAAGSFRPVEPGVLTVATNLPAQGFWDGDDADDLRGGFEYELALVLADRLGLDGLQIIEVPFEDLVSGEIEGYDVALAQVSITGGRAGLVDFSEPYLETPVGVVGQPGTTVTDLADARDLQWGVLEATTEEDLVASVIRPRGHDTVVFDTTEAALAGLRVGEVEVVALDYLRGLAEVSAAEDLVLLAEVTAPQHYGVVLPKGSSNTEAVNSAIRRLRRDGTLRDMERSLYDSFVPDVERNVATIRVTV